MKNIPTDYNRSTLLEHLLKSCDGYEYEEKMNEIINRCDVSPSLVSKWRNDRTSIPTKYLSTIAEIFDVTVDEFLMLKRA